MTSNGMSFFPANFMLQSSHEDHHHHHHHHHSNSPPSSLNPNIVPLCTPQDFHGAGVASFVGKRSSMSSSSFSGGAELVNNVQRGCDQADELYYSDDDDDNGSVQVGAGSGRDHKKRRLNMEQVTTLEKNFELGNKLEPERKMHLARALGLQPRQIAIWFQNRRARWKTKQLEKDYHLLNKQFQAIKSHNQSLKSHNQKLQAQIMALKSSRETPTESINLNKLETEGCSSNSSDGDDNIKLDISTNTRSSPPPPPPINDDDDEEDHSPTNRRHPLFLAQLFQTSVSKQQQQLDPQIAAKEETTSFSNMFCGMDDHSAFWPWLDHQHFN